MTRRIPASTTHHEAGHAVAAWYVGERIYAIHVAARESTFTDRFGREHQARGLAEISGVWNSLERFWRPTAARTSAERAVTRLRAVVSMLVSAAGPVAEARASRKSLHAILRTSRAHDPQYIRLTAAGFSDGAAMRREAWAGAQRLVRHGWPAIVALAAVLSRGSIDGERATSTIAKAWCAGVIPGVPRRDQAAR